MAEASDTRRRIITYGIIWFGQLVSLFGTGLSGFGIGVWVLQETGSVMNYGWIFVSASLPGLLIAPLAGALVDRFDRRWVLIVSDSVAAFSTVTLLLLVRSEALAVWHIFALNALSSAANSFQFPAFSASTTLLVPKRHLARATGSVQAGFAISQISAPLAAGFLLGKIGLPGLLLLDLATFGFAVLTLVFVAIPRPERSVEGRKARGSLASEALFGWHYIRQRPGLFALLILFAFVNFSNGIVNVLIAPLVLSFSTPEVLGRVLATAGAGMLGGSLFITAWGGPRRRMSGVFIFLIIGSIVLLLGGVEPNAILVSTAAFCFLFTFPVVNSLSQAIWQQKVEPDLQGRVFSIRRMIATATLPLGFLVSGPLADYVFEPLMADGGPLAGSVGRLIGTGKGRGLGLMILLLGLGLLMVVALLWRNPRLRNLEEEIPDAVGEVPEGILGETPELPV